MATTKSADRMPIQLERRLREAVKLLDLAWHSLPTEAGTFEDSYAEACLLIEKLSVEDLILLIATIARDIRETFPVEAYLESEEHEEAAPVLARIWRT
jgi:hypothetical protein